MRWKQALDNENVFLALKFILLPECEFMEARLRLNFPSHLAAPNAAPLSVV